LHQNARYGGFYDPEAPKGPRKFIPIKSKYDETFFVQQPPDYRPPDTN
jgi:hypothetical protein